jgi:MFS family permease
LQEKLKSNIWKYFVFSLTQRRHYIPILAIYFLTLPDTNAQQIGIYMGIGYLASFLLEIPSGYFSDKFGHKRTLVLAKVLLALSVLSFILAQGLPLFIIGSILMSLSFAFDSGTKAAFMHNTLIGLKREKEYTKITSKVAANVSLISVALIILLPFFTKISISLPLKINLAFDVIGITIALMFVSPKLKLKAESVKMGVVWRLSKSTFKTGFFPLALFLGAIGGFLLAIPGYRYVYLESLGFPIIFIGTVMGVSRLFWFLIGHKAHWLEEKIGIKKLLIIEMFLFPFFLILMAIFSNPYVVGLISAIMTGYFWGRWQIFTNYFLKHFIKDKRYKATMLSIKQQIQIIFQMIVVFAIGFVMTISYKLGYFVVGVALLIVLIIIYPYMIKYLRRTKSLNNN